MNRTLTVLLGLSLLSLQPALAQSTRTVFINGVALQATPFQKNGQTYYQFSEADLKRVGAITAGGVAPKIPAIRGCVGDTLFNGVYTVQLLQAGMDGDRFSAKLKVSNAARKPLYNFMAFSPSDVYGVTGTANAIEMSNATGPWIDTMLPGTTMTLQTSTNNTVAGTTFTRLVIRPDADSVKRLQEEKMPLAKVYNMEFDLTCKK